MAATRISPSPPLILHPVRWSFQAEDRKKPIVCGHYIFTGRGSSEAIGSRRLCLTDPCKNIADSSSTLIFRNLVINGLRPLLARNNNVCRITSSNNSRVSTASRAIPFGTWSRRLARLAFRNVRAKEGRIRRRQSMLPKLAAIETVFHRRPLSPTRSTFTMAIGRHFSRRFCGNEINVLTQIMLRLENNDWQRQCMR
jgi:hypothetical protein